MPLLGQSLRYKLQEGLLGKESGAQGCKAVVSMKSVNGLTVHSEDPVNYYVDAVMLHVLPRQVVLGIKVKTMLPWDPSGKISPKKPPPDHASIVEPNDEILPTTPISEQKGRRLEPPPMS